MATNVERVREIQIDGEKITARPLKIKYLKQFMAEFQKLDKVAQDNVKSTDVLIGCMVIAFQQYKPEWATVAELEDRLDLPTIYEIIEISAGIKFGDDGSPNR